MSKAAIRAERYHDISCGHRVDGHESKCAFLHGHNYRVTFVCQALNPVTPMYPEGVRIRVAGVDEIGRVLDFSVMKEKLCMWLESNWDHKFLSWAEDPVIQSMLKMLSYHGGADDQRLNAFHVFVNSVVFVPFNPTAENMARYLLDVIGPQQLAGTGVGLVSVTVEETRKCSASALNYF